jgi:AcrR family transcriptional regulator
LSRVTAEVQRRGPYRNGIRRREQIVQTASEVFAEFGYVGGSIRTIAGLVNTSPATLIQHFGSKEGLLMAVLQDWAARTEAFLGVEARGLEHFRAMQTLMDFHVDRRGLIELFLTMATEATSDQHPAREFIQRRYTYIVAEVVCHLREARDLGEISQITDHELEHEARVLVAVADGLELQWLLDPSVDLPGLFSKHLDQTIARWQARPAGQN